VSLLNRRVVRLIETRAEAEGPVEELQSAAAGA
jgi:hypothetical protein